MRPTGIGYRSPRERTPAYYTTLTDHRSKGLFSPELPSKTRQVKDFAGMKRGFGVTDRFLYKRIKERLAACQPNLSPATYNHHESFAKLNKEPCKMVIKTLDIPKEKQKDYKYIGQSLVYDPEVPLSPKMDQSRLALPGNRGIFTHPNLRPRTVGQSRGGRSRYRKTPSKTEAQSQVSHTPIEPVTAVRPLQLTQVNSEVLVASLINSERQEQHSCSNTSMTERGQTAASPRIIREDNCGCSTNNFFTTNDKDLFMSPSSKAEQNHQAASHIRVPSGGNGMRTLPRLSASQAVGNFRDIYSEKPQNQGKYRHVSEIDFHKSHEMTGKYVKKTSYNGNEDLQGKLMTSSEGMGSNEAGFSSITPIGASHADRRRVVTNANFYQSNPTAVTCNEGPPNSGIIDIKNNDAEVVNMASQKRYIEDKATTIRSQKSQGSMNNSRKSHSIRSLRQSQRQSRASQMQTNDFYIVGSLDTINVNYKIDKERQRVQTKPKLMSM